MESNVHRNANNFINTSRCTRAGLNSESRLGGKPISLGKNERGMMNEFNPISGFAQALPWSSSTMEYLVDRTQRTILFWDVLRKRGNNYLAHLRAGQPPVLVFDYEMVLDGRTFEQPVN